jgi:hypothetical protein
MYDLARKYTISITDAHGVDRKNSSLYYLFYPKWSFIKHFPALYISHTESGKK